MEWILFLSDGLEGTDLIIFLLRIGELISVFRTESCLISFPGIIFELKKIASVSTWERERERKKM
jgi:hypothetical protein